jgi:glycosyltransferase involved in cell wall biosynthesis
MGALGEKTGERASWASVSVIIPTLGLRSSLEGALTSVLEQEYPGPVEVIVVASAPSEDALPVVPARPGLSVLPHVPPLSPAAARNLAISRVSGDVLVFTDDDAIAEPGWLRSLVEASAGMRAVSGSIVNGTPQSAVGTCEYLLDRLDLYPGRPADSIPWHGDTVNLLIPRPVWDQYGPFVDHKEGADGRSIGGTDTAITSRLRRAGLLVFAPDARVAHLNRTRGLDMIRGQHRRGRSTAYLGRANIDHPWNGLLRHPLLAPVAAAARVFSVYRRCVRFAPELLGRAVRLFPLLLVALCAWGAGLATEGRLLDKHMRPATMAATSSAKGQAQ